MTRNRTRFRQDRRRLVVEEISAEALRSVLDPASDVLAGVVENFFNPLEAQRIAQRILSTKRWSDYGSNGAPDVAKLGDALFGCFAELGDGECSTYFQNAPANRRLIQQLLGSYANPVDRVVADVDRVWLPGCSILRIDGRVCALGLPRAFRDGGEARPHTDRASWDFARPETLALSSQLAFNVYLSMTSSGGGLELWDYRPTREEYEANREGYAIRRDAIPPSATIIRPQPGDLIIFDASRVHAVQPSTGSGVRVTFSGFLGFEDYDRPLRAFS